MNLERAIELVSSLETCIQRSKDGESSKYGQSYGSIAFYKDLVQIVNFIDEECSNDYGLRSLIKKFNDLKNVMACELYKKFLISELTKRLKGNQNDWINEEFAKSMNVDLKNMLETEVFRPTGPKKQFEWMSSLDMNKVLEQYEHYYPKFKYL